MKKMQKKARQDTKGSGKEGEGDKEKLSVKEEEPSKSQTLPRSLGVIREYELQVHILHHSSMTVAVTLKPQQGTKPPFKHTRRLHSPESRRRWRVTHFTTRTTYIHSPKVF